MGIVFLEWIGVLLAYWIPGAALASLFEWRGLGRFARWTAPFALSIAATPVLLVLPTLFGPYKPSLGILAAFSAVLFLAGGILARAGKRPVLEIRSRSAEPPSPRETAFEAAFVLLVTGLAALPRIHMILNGGEISTAVTTDTYWHIAETTAIARGGIPPRHYLFPDVPLIYYYWSWIYPAVLAGLPALGRSILRLLNVHAALNLLVFLSALLAFLRMNLRSPKARWFALIFLTLAGGFDFFTGPSLLSHEWWQSYSPALVSKVQIPALLTNFVTEPQHVAGATAFVFLLILWRNVRGRLLVRGILAVIAAAFMFGTSAFVFLSAVVGGIVWAVLHRRALRKGRGLLGVLGLAAFFLVLTGSQIALSLGQTGTVRWGEFRAVILEAATGTAYVRSVVIDQALTLLAFPLVAGVVLLIEIGLPFALYGAWFFRQLGKRPAPWRSFLAWYPAVYVPIAFLLQHTNFALRGMIPAQIAIVLGAAQALEAAGRFPWRRIQRAALGYGLALLAVAQIFSAAVEWWGFARRAAAEVMRFENGFLALPIPVDYAFADGDTHLIPPMKGLPPQLAYLYWANENLPADALVVEIGMPEDSNRIHLLERMRFVDPAELGHVLHAVRDLNIVNPQTLADWWESLGDGTVWEKALRSEYVLQNRVPVYVLVHGAELAELGEPVYRDEYATIYRLSDGQ
ncbi:MAG: hypothetical protein JW929_06235 [Anaerolineales bacterium]|nr:hypothetical protein [Anaerolineales bacterium]